MAAGFVPQNGFGGTGGGTAYPGYGGGYGMPQYPPSVMGIRSAAGGAYPIGQGAYEGQQGAILGSGLAEGEQQFGANLGTQTMRDRQPIQQAQETFDYNLGQKGADAALSRGEYAGAMGAAQEAANERTQNDIASNVAMNRKNLAEEELNNRINIAKGAFPWMNNPASALPPSSSAPSADIAGAEAASVARAKDRAGNNALASLRAIQDAATSSGTMGSIGPDLESGAEERVLSNAAADVGDVNRQQTINAIPVAQAGAQLDLAKRGQDLSFIQSMMPSLFGIINAGGGIY